MRLPSASALLAAFVASAGCQASHLAEQGTEPTIVQLRLAYADSAADRERHQLSDRIVYLAARPLLSDADITSANPSVATSGELLLALGFSPETGRRLAGTLEPHIGDRLAILVEGRVTDVVPIMSAVGAGGRLTLNTRLTGTASDRLREAIRRRWPPGG